MSLETIRIRFDIIETFLKCSNHSLMSTTRIGSIWFPLYCKANNIGYMNLERSFARTQVRENFFSIKVPPIWNSLPDDIKKSRTIHSFKNQFDIRAMLNGHLLNNNQRWTKRAVNTVCSKFLPSIHLLDVNRDNETRNLFAKSFWHSHYFRLP